MCMYTYNRYVNYTPHQYCSTLHFLSFSTKPTQTRYICVLFGQKEISITPNLWPFGNPLHLTWCCTRNWMIVAWRAVLPPPLLQFSSVMTFWARKYGGMKSQKKKRLQGPSRSLWKQTLTIIHTSITMPHCVVLIWLWGLPCCYMEIIEIFHFVHDMVMH